MEVVLIVILVLVVVLALYAVAIYNRLVALRNRFLNAFAQVEVQLKRRYDLIPNLVETAKKYLVHERETLSAVVEARNAAAKGLERMHGDPGDAGAVQALSRAESGLAGALGRFNVVVEAYPELKADQNMRQLSEELTSTENRVAFSRQAFNDAVMEYNTYRQSFPQTLLAGMFGHREDAALLQFADSERIQEAPRVSF
ncbi:MAG: LemA family protein [Gammaproteobacteria bacterium]|nr:LemA family protein [Gammaproteobacteria bacterium]